LARPAQPAARVRRPGLGARRLGAWLPAGRVDQKRLDTLAMLAEMRASQSATPSKPGFHFEWTYLWDEFVARAAEGTGPNGSTATGRILDELRLKGPEAYARIEVRALLRALASSGAARGGRYGGPRNAAERREPLGRESQRGEPARALRDSHWWISERDLDRPRSDRGGPHSTALRPPDHLDPVDVLAVLLEAESQVERLSGIALDDVERHRLLARRGVLEQVLDQPCADAGAAERGDQVKLAQVQPIDEFRHLNPTNILIPDANDLNLRLSIALPKSVRHPSPVPSTYFRQVSFSAVQIERDRERVITRLGRPEPEIRV
jgi:hypothetical protein